MILMSDTGGGHRASANALRDGFEALYGKQYEVDVVDLAQTDSTWPNKWYFFLVKYPILWRLGFLFSEPRVIHEPVFVGYTAMVGRRFAKKFEECKPDLIVSVHPLMQHVPLKILRRMKKTTPFATVVTDLTRCHVTWFHRAVDKCFVATQLVAAQALKVGLKASQIVCCGLPIRPSFSNPKTESKHKLRSKLGLHLTAPTVMLVGGGDGMGKLEATAAALAKTLSPEHQVLIICGRNQALADSLSSRQWPMKVVVRGFINNMSEYMCACDAIVTKAGPGTIAEALICGLPIVLNGCIPCQEEGNVDFVRENEVGEYSEKPAEIADIVAGWFSGKDSAKLEEMSARAKKLGRPEATFNIVRGLHDLCIEGMTRVAAEASGWNNAVPA